MEKFSKSDYTRPFDDSLCTTFHELAKHSKKQDKKVEPEVFIERNTGSQSLRLSQARLLDKRGV